MTLGEFDPALSRMLSQVLEGGAKPTEGTAVEDFARWHESSRRETEKRYEGLIPLTQPVPGEQYAFEVDLDRCSGCKACVTACHSLNGLDEGESWRQVGMLRGSDAGQKQTFLTSSCHHCVDPACSNGCPVLAYDKDVVTGIVRHLDDQCMGCRYCEWTCPYGAPQWNADRGIVRKCDMCHQRLAAGEPPACVQACPNRAIAVRLVPRNAEGLAALPGTMDLPGCVESSFTTPTTRYLSADPSRTAGATAEGAAHPEESHAPLAFLLVAVQAAVGLLLFAPPGRPVAHWSLACILSALAITVGTAHLGRPLRAWKAFLGWRRSWFSREVLAIGALPAILGPLALGLVPSALESAAVLGALGVGLFAVGCSAMIYLSTRRPTWRHWNTPLRFAGTTILLGTVIGRCLAPGASSVAALLLALAGKILAEWLPLLLPDVPGRDMTSESRVSWRAVWRLLSGPLAAVTWARWGLALVGLVLVLLDPTSGFLAPSAIVAALLFFAGECLERRLFFQTAIPARMPGGPLG